MLELVLKLSNELLSRLQILLIVFLALRYIDLSRSDPIFTCRKFSFKEQVSFALLGHRLKNLRLATEVLGQIIRQTFQLIDQFVLYLNQGFILQLAI